MKDDGVIEKILSLKEVLSTSKGIARHLGEELLNGRVSAERKSRITAKINREKIEQAALSKEVAKLSSYLAYLEKRENFLATEVLVEFQTSEFNMVKKQLKFINQHRIAVIDNKSLGYFLDTKRFNVSFSLNPDNIYALIHTLSEVEHSIKFERKFKGFSNFHNTILSSKRIKKTGEIISKMINPLEFKSTNY